MSSFTVIIHEITEYLVPVEATSIEEAIQKGEERWANSSKPSEEFLNAYIGIEPHLAIQEEPQ